MYRSELVELGWNAERVGKLPKDVMSPHVLHVTVLDMVEGAAKPNRLREVKSPKEVTLGQLEHSATCVMVAEAVLNEDSRDRAAKGLAVCSFAQFMKVRVALMVKESEYGLVNPGRAADWVN